MLYQALTNAVLYKLQTGAFVNLNQSYNGNINGMNNFNSMNANVIGLRTDIRDELVALGLYNSVNMVSVQPKEIANQAMKGAIPQSALLPLKNQLESLDWMYEGNITFIFPNKVYFGDTPWSYYANSITKLQEQMSLIINNEYDIYWIEQLGANYKTLQGYNPVPLITPEQLSALQSIPTNLQNELNTLANNIGQNNASIQNNGTLIGELNNKLMQTLLPFNRNNIYGDGIISSNYQNNKLQFTGSIGEMVAGRQGRQYLQLLYGMNFSTTTGASPFPPNSSYQWGKAENYINFSPLGILLTLFPANSNGAIQPSPSFVSLPLPSQVEVGEVSVSFLKNMTFYMWGQDNETQVNSAMLKFDFVGSANGNTGEISYTIQDNTLYLAAYGANNQWGLETTSTNWGFLSPAALSNNFQFNAILEVEIEVWN